jgi:hypothetical protein
MVSADGRAHNKGTKNEERCFLCDMYRDVISRTISENYLVLCSAVQCSAARGSEDLVGKLVN